MPLSSADNDSQLENGAADDKQPLKNGTADKAHIVEAADRTDEAARPEEGPLRSMFGAKYKNRKYKMYDNGKRSSSSGGGGGLSPLKSSRRHRVEQRMRERTGLNRFGLALLALCVLLSIALLVCAILWPKRGPSGQHPVCVKPSCLRLSAEILPKLNLPGAPCDDFQNYACGKWFSSKSLPKDRSEWNLKELLQFSYRRKIHELLVTSTISRVSTKFALPWKLMNFYDSCMSIDNINTEDDRPLKKIIDTLGGWLVLKSYEPTQWDTHKTIKSLHSDHNVSPFFQIDVVPDTRNNKQNIVQLKPPSFGLPNINYYYQSETSEVITAYMRFIKDIVQSFGATTKDASQFSQDLFHFEKRIAENLDLKSENKTISYARLRISELTPILMPIQLYDILIGTLPNAHLNTDNFVLVENIEYFKKLPSLISMSDNESLNKYLIWRLVAEYLPYLSTKYQDTLSIFRNEFLGQTEPIPRWEFCIATLQRFAGFGLMAMYENITTDRAAVAVTISRVFDETVNIIKKDMWKLIPAEIQTNLTDKISSIGFQVGLPSSTLKMDYVNEYYLSLNAIKNDFFQNVRNGISFVLETLQRRLKNSNEEFKWLNDMTSQPFTVSYNAAANKIIVPSTVLQFPYFENDYPLPSVYAGLGREIASALVSSLLINKQRSNKTTTDKKDYVDILGKCVLHVDLARLNISDPETFIVTLAGLKYAYQSLNNELSVNELSHQPAMESFENSELFFISYAQSMCTIKTPKKERNDLSFSSALSSSQLTNTVLKQLPEFTDRYSCGSTSQFDGSLCNM